MISKFERLIALRYLRTRGKDSAVTTIAMFSLAGITLGVMTLIVVLSVMRGVRMEMINSIIGLEGHVTVVSGQSPHLGDYQHYLDSIAALDGVKRATPIVQGQVMLSYRGRAVGALASGLRPEDLSLIHI